MVDAAVEVEDLHLAEATFAAAAVVHHVDSCALERLEHRLALVHRDSDAKPGHCHLKRCGLKPPGVAKGLVAQSGHVPAVALPRAPDLLHQTDWSAHVELGVGRNRVDQGLHAHAAVLRGDVRDEAIAVARLDLG